MTQILKRLEIIKSSIIIEDEESLELQIVKLQRLEVDDTIKAMLHKLQKMEYANAIEEIEHYLAKYYSGVTHYIDTQIQGLKLALKVLKSTLQELVEQKIDVTKQLSSEIDVIRGAKIGSIKDC